jgi:hypothetical protein
MQHVKIVIDLAGFKGESIFDSCRFNAAQLKLMNMDRLRAVIGMLLKLRFVKIL